MTDHAVSLVACGTAVVSVLLNLLANWRGRIALATTVTLQLAALATEVAGIKGTLANAMARLGEHGEQIAVLRDRTAARGASAR